MRCFTAFVLRVLQVVMLVVTALVLLSLRPPEGAWVEVPAEGPWSLLRFLDIAILLVLAVFWLSMWGASRALRRQRRAS